MNNINTLDRWLRILGGLLVLFVGYIFGISWSLSVGLLIMYQGLTGWCVWNQLVGKNTCEIDTKNTSKSTISNPFLRLWLTGITILIIAITLNYFAKIYSVATWYDILVMPNNFVTDFASLLFLTITYPVGLALPISWWSQRSK